MTPSDLKQVKSIAREFRTGLLGNEDGKAKCFMYSSAVSGYLEFCGFPNRLTEGTVGNWNHFWITFPDGAILDGTADQFGLPKVYVGKKPENYKEIIHASR